MKNYKNFITVAIDSPAAAGAGVVGLSLDSRSPFGDTAAVGNGDAGESGAVAGAETGCYDGRLSHHHRLRLLHRQRRQRLRLLRVQTNNGGAEATAKHVV